MPQRDSFFDFSTVLCAQMKPGMREQAGVIQTEVGKLLEDVGRLDERVGKLQRHFEQANEDLRQIRISSDKVARRGERIEELEFEEPQAAEEAIAPAKPRIVGS